MFLSVKFARIISLNEQSHKRNLWNHHVALWTPIKNIRGTRLNGLRNFKPKNSVLSNTNFSFYGQYVWWRGQFYNTNLIWFFMLRLPFCSAFSGEEEITKVARVEWRKHKALGRVAYSVLLSQNQQHAWNPSLLILYFSRGSDLSLMKVTQPQAQIWILFIA